MIKVVDKIKEIRRLIKDLKNKGYKIGFVPTMGYFHEGHLALMKKAKRLSDKVVVSIFVNPTQFGPNEDLDKYPRDLKRDIKLAEEVGVDLIFAPDSNEMYEQDFQTWVTVEKLSKGLCGDFRPGHFKGVATVVTKLFNIVQPDIAIFGQKDYQQLLVIKRLVKDLNMPIEIVGHPIVREKDGLAMSSRNTYLSSKERESALSLYKSLKYAKELIKKGERSPSKIKNEIKNIITSYPLTKIEYIFLGDPHTLNPYSETIKDRILIALAVWVGSTRLIDNIIIEIS